MVQVVKIVPDARGTPRFAEPESARRRHKIVRDGLKVRMHYCTTGGWERIVLTSQDPSTWTHLVPEQRALQELARDNPYHITVVTKSERKDPTQFTPSCKIAAAKVKQWFQDEYWYTTLKIKYVSGFTYRGGHIAQVADDSCLEPIQHMLKYLRHRVGKHGGGPLTISM